MKKFFLLSLLLPFISSLQAQDWRIQEIPEAGISLETPYELTYYSLISFKEHTGEVKKQLYYYHYSDSLNITLICLETSSEQYAKKFITDIVGISVKDSKGNIQYTTDTLSTKEFMKAQFNGSIPEKKKEVKAFWLKKGDVNYLLTCTYLAEDKYRKDVGRIINSVKISD